MTTHCKRNHEFTEENTYVTKLGKRVCRACKRELMRLRREGTQVGYANSNKTQCAKGHPYDSENTTWFTRKNGKTRRICKACDKANQSRIRVTRYGITQEYYQSMLDSQNNKCAICAREFVRTPHIDHNHTTEVVRGLLCYSCNGAIGQFHENVNTLKAAIKYLESFSNTDMG